MAHTARLVVPIAVQRRRQRYNTLSWWFFVAAVTLSAGFILLAELAKH